jgi:hypothetical protein
MPNPSDHTKQRGAIESVLRKIPGFKGYLEKEYRRESDALQRTWLADRLARSKRGIDDLAGALAAAGRLDALPECDRLRARVDKLIGRVRGAMQGYSGFFDLVQVDEALLDRVYQHDVSIMDRFEEAAEAIEKLGTAVDDPGAALATASAQVRALDESWDLRVDMLKGLE